MASRSPVAAADARHLSLLMRLLSSSTPLTSEELFATVEGYRTEPGEPPAERGALEKRFERDRRTLHDAGIEVETVPDPTAPGDRARWRFRISSDAASVRSAALTADETLLVDLATSIWQTPEVAGSARRAYLKLAAQGDSGVSASPSVPRIALETDPAFAALHTAIATEREVEFDYAKAGSTAAERRRIVPLRLVVVDGRWLCNAFDLDRREERNFLLTRIVGEVHDAGPRTEHVEARTDLPRVLADLARANPATIAVAPGTDAEMRLRRRALGVAAGHEVGGATWAVLTVPSWDHELLADELAGLGRQVRVLAPDALGDLVLARIDRVLALHAEPGERSHDG